MGEFHIHGPGLHVCGTTLDAVFRDERGRPVLMDFHNYLGPWFYDRDDKEVIATPHIWRQWYGWWNARGRHIYKPSSEAIEYREEPEDDEDWDEPIVLVDSSPWDTGTSLGTSEADEAEDSEWLRQAKQVISK